MEIRLKIHFLSWKICLTARVRKPSGPRTKTRTWSQGQVQGQCHILKGQGLMVSRRRPMSGPQNLASRLRPSPRTHIIVFVIGFRRISLYIKGFDKYNTKVHLWRLKSVKKSIVFRCAGDGSWKTCLISWLEWCGCQFAVINLPSRHLLSSVTDTGT